MFQLKETFGREISPVVYATYPEACKARDAINAAEYKAGKTTMWSAFEVNAAPVETSPIDPLWINKELPKVEFTDEMYGSPRMTNTNDQPEGYQGE